MGAFGCLMNNGQSACLILIRCFEWMLPKYGKYFRVTTMSTTIHPLLSPISSFLLSPSAFPASLFWRMKLLPTIRHFTSLRRLHSGILRAQSIPLVIDNDGRIERVYDIYSRLLKDRIICVMTPVSKLYPYCASPSVNPVSIIRWVLSFCFLKTFGSFFGSCNWSSQVMFRHSVDQVRKRRILISNSARAIKAVCAEWKQIPCQ